MKLIIEIPEEVYEKQRYSQHFGAWSVVLQKCFENGTPLNEYIDKAFDDLGKCKCGSSYIVIDGEEYRTDTGYAFEGIDLFINYIKGTLSKAEREERNEK